MVVAIILHVTSCNFWVYAHFLKLSDYLGVRWNFFAISENSCFELLGGLGVPWVGADHWNRVTFVRIGIQHAS